MALIPRIQRLNASQGVSRAQVLCDNPYYLDYPPVRPTFTTITSPVGSGKTVTTIHLIAPASAHHDEYHQASLPIKTARRRWSRSTR